MSSHSQKFELEAFKFHGYHASNMVEDISILLSTNLFRMNKPLYLPSINDLHSVNSTHQTVVLFDREQRQLIMDVTIVHTMKYQLKMTVSVPYVFFNKTGMIYKYLE